MADVNACIKPIKENIEYITMCKMMTGRIRICMMSFLRLSAISCVKRNTVRIAGEDYPYELVKSKFLKLNSGHLKYVIRCMHETNKKITIIKAYMVTALDNAPTTINHYYQQEVQYDMYGGGW